MRTSHDLLLTDMRHASGWYAMLPPPGSGQSPEGQTQTPTGWWSAPVSPDSGPRAGWRSSPPEARVILLEEYRVGYGASGRNSGFIIETPHFTEGFDAEYNGRVSRVVLAGLGELERLSREHGIECEWSPRGHLHAVVGKRWASKLESTRRMLESIDEEYDWLEGNALADVVGTRHYHAAVYTPRTVLMNPAALCRGLGDTMPANVEVFEESPVQKVEPGSPVRIECAQGSIRARNVLLTTNAFVTRLGYLQREVFPMIACCSLSRPLTEDEEAAMGGESDWGLTPAVWNGATVRRTLSKRILFRHGARYTANFRLSENMRRRVGAAHREGVRKRFPMLLNLDIEHTWAGVFCVTRDWASVFGHLDAGVFASLGYAGIGVPRGTISGKLLTEHALGGESDLIRDVQAISGPKRLPPKPLLALGVSARIWWWRQRARAEC